MPWTIRFDFLVGCSYGNLVPSFLPFRTSPAAVALVIYQTIVKPCVVYCVCVVVGCFLCYCVYFSVVVVCFFVVMYFVFATLVVGSEVLLCNHFGFLISRLSGSFPSI
jgi:hypothetical protein